MGKDGFLFHRFEMAFEQLCGDAVPDDRQLTRWVSLFEARLAWCTAKGATYTSLVIPERHVIYADKLPDGIAVSQRRPIRRLLPALDPRMRQAVLYPEAELRAARTEQDVFLFTDEHVNGFGSYVCYRALLAWLGAPLGLTPVPLAQMTRARRHASGNLGMRLEEEPVEEMESLHIDGNGGAARTFLNGEGYARVEVFEHADAGRPKAVIFGDSNVFPLRSFLVPHFSRTVILYDSQRLFQDLVRSEQPDVVINIMSESRLGNLAPNRTVVLPVDADIVDFVGHCGQALPGARDRFMVDFTSGGNSPAFTRAGWSAAEPGHRWMIDDRSLLELPAWIAAQVQADGADGLVMECEVRPMLDVRTRFQRLDVSIGAGEVWLDLTSVILTGVQGLVLPLRRPALPAGSAVFLRFDHPDAAAPLMNDSEARRLAFAIKDLWITRAPDGGLA